MTSIKVYKNLHGDIVKYILEGHTMFAESGSDIVCAAVSSLAMNTLNGLTDVLGIQVGFEVAEGYLECILPSELEGRKSYGAQVLLKSMLLSFESLEKQHKNHITITELEV